MFLLWLWSSKIAATCKLFKATRWRRSAHRSVHFELFFFLKKWNNVFFFIALATDGATCGSWRACSCFTGLCLRGRGAPIGALWFWAARATCVLNNIEKECHIFYMFIFALLHGGLSLLCIDRRPLCPMATLLTHLKSWSPKAFFGLALFAADKSLAICVFLQVLWHPVSISVLCSCDSCVSEVADHLTETVRTLNISTQKPFFFARGLLVEGKTF